MLLIYFGLYLFGVLIGIDEICSALIFHELGSKCKLICDKSCKNLLHLFFCVIHLQL